jgi:cation transport regulator ChaC
LAFSSFSKDWGGGVADVVEEEGADVEGVLFPLSARDVLRLDVQEGLEEGDYRRRMVTVELEDGSSQEAMAYVVSTKRPHVPPSHAYLDEMVSCATEQGLSETYVHFLLALYPDPDAARRAYDDDE